MSVCNPFPVFTGKEDSLPHPLESETEDRQYDIVESESTNLPLETLSKSVVVLTSGSVSGVQQKGKVSSGCGPSPPREIKSEKISESVVHELSGIGNNLENGVSRDYSERKMVTTSTGTSPPPQSISTQVSGTLNFMKGQKNIKKKIKPLIFLFFFYVFVKQRNKENKHSYVF